MTKTRKLTATFANGQTITRNTTIDTLGFGWRAVATLLPEFRDSRTEIVQTGFASTADLAQKAGQRELGGVNRTNHDRLGRTKFLHRADITVEVVPVTVL